MYGPVTSFCSSTLGRGILRRHLSGMELRIDSRFASASDCQPDFGLAMCARCYWRAGSRQNTARAFWRFVNHDYVVTVQDRCGMLDMGTGGGVAALASAWTALLVHPPLITHTATLLPLRRNLSDQDVACSVGVDTHPMSAGCGLPCSVI